MAKPITYKGKPAQLIIESRQDCQFVAEAVDEHVPSGALGRLFGTYATIGERNRNGRTYNFENYFAQVQTLLPSIKAKRLFGELEHVKRRTVKYGNVSHRIDSIEWNPDKQRFEGWITILDTPAGRIAWAVVAAGSPLFVSSRALGVVNPTTGATTLLKLITYDLVCEPSFPEAEFNLVGSVNESKDTLICESVDDEDSPNSLMLQLIELARTGMLQKLFPDALIGSASLDALKQQLINESIENFTTMTNQSRFVEAYNNADANEVGVENIQKVEALLDEVGCDYTDVGLATAFDALSEENKKQAMSLLGIDFTNEDAKPYDISKLDDAALTELAKALELEVEDKSIDDIKAAIEAELDNNLDKHNDVAKQYGIVECDEALNFDYLDAAWGALTDEVKTEIVEAAKVDDKDAVIAIKSFKDIPAEAQQPIIDAMLDKNLIEKELVNIDESADNKWDALSDDERKVILDKLSLSEFYRPNVKWQLVDKDHKLKIEAEFAADEAKHATLGEAWDSFTDDQRQSILSKHIGLPYNAKTKWAGIDIAHHAMLEKDIDAIDEAEAQDNEGKSFVSIWGTMSMLNRATALKAVQPDKSDEDCFQQAHDNEDALGKELVDALKKHLNIDEEQTVEVYDKNGDKITAELTGFNGDKVSFKYNGKESVAIKEGDKYMLYDGRYETVKALDESAAEQAFIDDWNKSDADGRKATAKQANIADDVELVDFDKLPDNVQTALLNAFVNEASDPAADWWYNASVADRNQLIEQVGKDKIGVEDAANATWEMFDNESRNAIAAAIRAQSADESIDAPYDMSNDIKKGDKIVVGSPEQVAGTTEFTLDVWPAGKPEQKLTLHFDDKKDPEYLALVDDCDESIKRPKFVCEAKSFDDVKIGSKAYDNTEGEPYGKVVEKGVGAAALRDACKRLKVVNDDVADDDIREMIEYADVAEKSLNDFKWVIVKDKNYGGNVWGVYGNNGMVSESVDAWNSADVATRKDWLLSKNYLEADSEYYASQAYDGLPADVQNFVKEFFEAPVDEAAVGDNIKIYDADGNEFEAVVNTIDNNEAGTRLTVTYGESTSGIVAEVDGKWTLVPASEPGKIVNESIVADKLYATYSDTDKSIIDKFYQDDIVKTCIKNIDPDKSTMDDKVAAAYDELIKAQKSAEAVDELEANKSLLIAYIAAQLQDEMVNEGKLIYKPKTAKFINEAAEDNKPTPADVEQIIDGLVDASTITRAQADELIDAVSDAADLDKVENKAQLAEKIAETAEELGFDVDVEECMSMVNEGVDDNIREAVLKDKSYDDFDFRTVERDGSTISVVISKDGQLTGIEVAGDLTDANQKMLSDMLRTYLGAQATDECLTNIKHEIAALRRQTKQLATRYDAAGVAVLDENLQPIDHTPLYLKHMPTAYKYIYESLTPEQKSLIATQAAVRTFVNESDVAAFYRSRNWAAIKSYSTKQPVGFVNENVDGSGKSSLTPEQQRLVDLIRG